MIISIAHSPDSDDAFMFYALTHGKIDTEGFRFEHVLQDIQKCNEDALREKFDVTAISFASYPELAGHYQLMTSGASMGERGYGPMLVAKERFSLKQLPKKRIAIPGEKTTAVLLLKLFCPEATNTKVISFDRIIDAVQSGEADVGLLIHEGQLTYRQAGLVALLNFGTWWWEKEKLPLPLGGNVIRRSLDLQTKSMVNRLLKESIQYALDHRAEALDYALRYARDLAKEKADQFVGMYVNHRTVNYGEEGRRAVRRLLRLGAERGFLKHVEPEFVIES